MHVVATYIYVERERESDRTWIVITCNISSMVIVKKTYFARKMGPYSVTLSLSIYIYICLSMYFYKISSLNTVLGTFLKSSGSESDASITSGIRCHMSHGQNLPCKAWQPFYEDPYLSSYVCIYSYIFIYNPPNITVTRSSEF